MSQTKRFTLQLSWNNKKPFLAFFVRGEVCISHASWDRSHGRAPLWTYPPPPLGPTNTPARYTHPQAPCPGPPPPLDIPIPLASTFHDLPNHSLPPPPPKQHLVGATETETGTVSKQAVCILLECCLVMTNFTGPGAAAWTLAPPSPFIHYYIYFHWRH